VQETSSGNDLRTTSVFAGNTWRTASNLTWQAGVRLDDEHDRDSSGRPVIRHRSLSPRLAATWDIARDGRWIVTAGAARYVASVNTTVVDAASAAGRPATFVFDYLGPAINANASAPLANTADALRTLFGWFQANGGTSRTTRSAPSIPGVTSRIDPGLRPPNATEFVVGLTRRLGGRGSIRLEGVFRKYADFYANKRDLTTGRVRDALGQTRDLLIVTNTNAVRRTYAGIHTQLSVRFGTRLQVMTSYTLSGLRGNFDGENAASGLEFVTITDYPEYRKMSWSAPDGWLASDERHRLRVWATWNPGLPPHFGRATIGLVQRLESGRPWSAAGSIDPRAYVVNPGYVTPPSAVQYYFSPRGAYRTDTITATDLSLYWSMRVPQTTRLQMFARAVLTNAFNQAGVDGMRRTVLTRNDSAALRPFDPFTETPVRGVHYEFGSDFGQPASPADYQVPRQFSISLGLRF
jgi:hypothetical protein